jgi:hypothetical protein
MQKDVAPIKAVRPISFLSRIAAQGTNYTTAVLWLLQCAFRGRLRTLFLALGLSGLYLATQAAGIYCIYRYARLLETGGVAKLPYLGLSFDGRTDVRLLWAVVILAAICFMASAAFHFLSRRVVLNLVEQRYARSLEELVQQAGRLPDPRARVASRIFMNFGLAKISSGCRFGYVTSVIFCNAISGVLGGIGAALFLFYIDTPLTLLILLAAAFGALFLYPLTLRAVGFAKAREKTQGAVRDEARRISLDQATETSGSGETFGDVSRAQFGVWRVNFEIIFALEIGKTLILAAVIYYMANEMMAGRQNWAILIAYVGALRLVLMACTQSIRAYASVSRFYPQISRYSLFTKDIQHLDDVTFVKVSAGDTLLLGTLNNGGDIIAAAGERLALATTDSLRDLKFALLHARSKTTSGPLEVSVFDLKNAPDADAAILLVNADQIEDTVGDGLRQHDKLLADRAALIIYRTTAKIGECGEKRLLVAQDGEFRRLEFIGTPECDAALAEFAHQLRSRHLKLDDEEDELEDGDL